MKKKFPTSSFSLKNGINFPVLKPISKVIVFWDLLQILTIILSFLWIPFKISFKVNHIIDLFGTNLNDLTMERILLVALASDVIIGCNLAYISKGIIVKYKMFCD